MNIYIPSQLLVLIQFIRSARNKPALTAHLCQSRICGRRSYICRMTSHTPNGLRTLKIQYFQLTK